MLGFFQRGDECEKYFKLGRTLGQGSFATVRVATEKKTNSKYAVKVIQKKKLNKSDTDALAGEVEVMRKIRHENIVQLHHVFDCQSKFYMVIDLCTGGELFDRVVKKQFYSEVEAKECLRQINAALHYCHQKEVVHRDLKPENLLYARPEPNETLKLADFGLAYIVDAETMMTTACGTPGYVAPEVLTGSGYGMEVDMWSLGVVLYILLCGYPPFYDDSTSVLFELIKRGQYEFTPPYWDDVSEEAKDLVQKLLTVDPKKRATAFDVVAHPWMRSESTNNSHLSYFSDNLSAYNARRKFRRAIMGMQVVNMLRQGQKPGEQQATETGQADASAEASVPADVKTGILNAAEAAAAAESDPRAAATGGGEAPPAAAAEETEEGGNS